MIRSLPLFDTFRTALSALANSVGGPAGLSTLLTVHCRPGVQEAAQQLLDGTLEEVLAARRAQLADAARQSVLSGWHGGGALLGDLGEEDDLESDMS